MRWEGDSETGEPGSGDDPGEERTGYGRWEEEDREAGNAGTQGRGPGADGTGGAEDGVGIGNPGGAGPGSGDRVHGTCELCGGPTLERHCKIQCLRCGYQRDCSDP